MTGDLCLIPDSVPFTMSEQIGTGSFATVYKAEDKDTKAVIAVKSYRMKVNNRSHIARAATEIAFIKILRHPNIITYVSSEIKKYYMYLGIEYSPYGSLINYMEKRYSLSEEIVKLVMTQLLSALCYLHSQCIFHGDVKPENILLFEEKQLKIKLTDFGLTEVIMKNQMIQKKTGSFFYMSPEIHLGFPADYRSDLFSAGIVMYEMLYSNKPFPTRIVKNEYVTLLRKRIPIHYPEPESSAISSDCMSLLKNLLSYDKDKRLLGVNSLNHPFIKTDLVKDEQNHYICAYESFLTSLDLAQENQYGESYIAVMEAVLHLQIHSTIVDDPGLHKYLMLKLREFTIFSERVLEKILNDSSAETLDVQSDTERLRCLLHSSPELLAAYDLCVVGEMYVMQNDVTRGKGLVKNGLDVLISKMPQEPEGLRKQLLGSKIAKWVNLLEDCSAGPSHSGQQQSHH